ncbi:MAG: VOC family protein [Acidobacteria bacterium]|nr:VOC family protein [Acidobacteriota bacterium]
MDKGRPAIVCPVMRTIGVAELDRSAAFYRDVLGFEIREEQGAIEAISGPARVRFGPAGYAPLEWENPRPSGSGMLFFQCADAAAMREYLVARGGAPGEIEKVNWVKLRLFEIRDPDGNTLWFGDSYDEPEKPRPTPMMQKALPEVTFRDVAAAVDYYRDVLGFHINYQQEDLGVMDRDEITVLLLPRGEERGIGSFEVYVRDADALYAELVAKGANAQGPPVSRPWGLRDFAVLDLDGNRITFAQTFE